MNHLPRQLQRQAEEIAAYDKAVEDARTGQTPQAEADPKPEPVEPVGEPTVAPTPKAPTAPVPTDDQWRQRYQTLEGKYRAEVPRLHSELKDLRDQLSSALQSIESIKKPAATPAAPRASKVTPKDVETFGSDLVDLIKRQSEDIVSVREQSLQEKIDKLAAENENLKSQVTGVTKTQGATAQEMYLGKLSQLVPDWAEINVDPAFLDWLGGVDELSGLSRQAYVDNAYSNLDAQRTATIFNAWKTIRTPAVPAQVKAADVQRQVTPGKSKSVPATSSDAANKVWSGKEIEDFYRSVQAGRISAADAAKTEAEIDLAVSQGRIKG